MRDIIALACTECKRRNYSTTKNKKKTSERLELSKYCFTGNVDDLAPQRRRK
jgi:large subunit ribosomal protein L33